MPRVLKKNQKKECMNVKEKVVIDTEKEIVIGIVIVNATGIGNAVDTEKG